MHLHGFGGIAFPMKTVNLFYQLASLASLLHHRGILHIFILKKVLGRGHRDKAQTIETSRRR